MYGRVTVYSQDRDWDGKPNTEILPFDVFRFIITEVGYHKHYNNIDKILDRSHLFIDKNVNIQCK